MALPSIMRKLFRNDGYGPLLKDEIVDRHISIQDWSGTYDYPINTLVRGSNGVLYWSVAQSGPNAGGAQNPIVDDGTHWVKMPSMADIAAQNYATQTWVASYVSSVDARPTVYVNANSGSDSNDGLTSATAKKTIAAAVNAGLGNLNYNPGYITVHIAPGTYNENVYSRFGTTIEYIGEEVSGYIPVVNDIFSSSFGSIILHGKFEVHGRVYASRSSLIYITDDLLLSFPDFGTKTSAIDVTVNSTVSIFANVNVSIGFYGIPGSTTIATVNVTTGSVFVNQGSITWAGAISGKRHRLLGCGVLSGIGSDTAIPGTDTGTADSTSYFS